MEQTVCERCGTASPPQARSCWKCGAKLPWTRRRTKPPAPVGEITSPARRRTSGHLAPPILLSVIVVTIIWGLSHRGVRAPTEIAGQLRLASTAVDFPVRPGLVLHGKKTFRAIVANYGTDQTVAFTVIVSLDHFDQPATEVLQAMGVGLVGVPSGGSKLGATSTFTRDDVRYTCVETSLVNACMWDEGRTNGIVSNKRLSGIDATLDLTEKVHEAFLG